MTVGQLKARLAEFNDDAQVHLNVVGATRRSDVYGHALDCEAVRLGNGYVVVITNRTPMP